MPSGEVIFFDLGWTLEDESPAQAQRAFETATHCRRWGFGFGTDALIDGQRAAGARGEASVYPAALAGLGLSPEQIDEVRQAISWKPAGLRLYDGVAHLVAALARRYSLGIIANQSRPVRQRLEAYGIAEAFRWVLCSCELGFEKPDPRIFRMAETRCGVEPGRIWMVGDRVDNDIAPARQRGWKTLRVCQGDHAGYTGKTPAETPDHEVADPRAMARIFGGS